MQRLDTKLAHFRAEPEDGLMANVLGIPPQEPTIANVKMKEEASGMYLKATFSKNQYHISFF